jgi:hypothetical protein
MRLAAASAAKRKDQVISQKHLDLTKNSKDNAFCRANAQKQLFFASFGSGRERY